MSSPGWVLVEIIEIYSVEIFMLTSDEQISKVDLLFIAM